MVALHFVAFLVLDVGLQYLGVVLVEDVEYAPGGPGAVVVLFVLLLGAVDRLHDVLDRGRLAAWPLAPVGGLEDCAFLCGRILLVESVPVAGAESRAGLLERFER